MYKPREEQRGAGGKFISWRRRRPRRGNRCATECPAGLSQYVLVECPAVTGEAPPSGNSRCEGTQHSTTGSPVLRLRQWRPPGCLTSPKRQPARPSDPTRRQGSAGGRALSIPIPWGTAVPVSMHPTPRVTNACGPYLQCATVSVGVQSVVAAPARWGGGGAGEGQRGMGRLGASGVWLRPDPRAGGSKISVAAEPISG